MQKRIGDFIRNDELQKEKFEVMDKVHRTIVYVIHHVSYAVIVLLLVIKFLTKLIWIFIDKFLCHLTQCSAYYTLTVYLQDYTFIFLF